MSVVRSNVTRARQKNKKLHRLYKNGAITSKDVYGGVQSWLAYASNFDAFYTTQNILKLCKQLFYERRSKYVLQSY